MINCIGTSKFNRIGVAPARTIRDFRRSILKMKRTANLGLSLLLTLAVAIPTLAQQEAPDVTAYRTLFNEKDPAKQAELAEKFLAESGQAFKDSMYRENAFLLLSQSYLALKNWDKAMAAAEKIDQLVPAAKPGT